MGGGCEGYRARLRSCWAFAAVHPGEQQEPHLLDLADLLVHTADHVVGRVGHLLDLHEAHERVHLRWQDLVQRVRIVPERDPCVRRALVDVNVLV